MEQKIHNENLDIEKKDKDALKDIDDLIFEGETPKMHSER